jgi:hypothetical protein
MSPVLVQMWWGWAQSRRRCGQGEPNPGADVAGGEPSPDADVAGVCPFSEQVRPRLDNPLTIDRRLITQTR